MPDEITSLTATELAQAIRLKRVSAVEALRAYLERIRTLNPALNAIVTMNPQAVVEARRADEALARGELLGPLHGVPITIKDCFETAGLRTTSGYEPLANYVPAEDAPTVAKLRAAGAVMVGKTNLPSLAGDSQSFNAIFGRTNNPWNLEFSPGGSSGGESAAIAARISPLGLGSDIGGSIRQPCHCTAVMGIKPTEYLVSSAGYLEGRGGPKSERHMNTVGPLARSVEDLDLALRIIAGPDRRFLETPPVALPPLRPRALRGLRVAWSPSFPSLPVEPSIREGLAAFAAKLDALGARVEQTFPAGFDAVRANELWGSIYFAESGAQLDPAVERPQAEERGISADSPEPILRGAARVVNASLRLAVELLEERDRLARLWERFFDDWDVFLCPPSPSLGPAHSEKGPPIEVDSQMLPYSMALDSYAMPFNVTGHPGVVLPLGIAEHGLPFGYQAIGRRWGDVDLLGIAATLALVSGPCPVPPGY